MNLNFMYNHINKNVVKFVIITTNNKVVCCIIKTYALKSLRINNNFKKIENINRIYYLNLNVQSGANIIIPCSFVVIFLMKNFDPACEISLFNPLEFIPSSRENDIVFLTPFAKVIAFSNGVITFAPLV